MRKTELERLKKMLIEMRLSIVMGEKTHSIDENSLESMEMPDEGDKACSETNQKLAYRIIERDRKLLKKIEKTLLKFDEGTYGICEKCEEDIGVKRLKVRPVTSLCIDCKEDEERMEKRYHDVEEE